MTNPSPLYSTYAQVPYYRKQSFFWLTYVLFSPIALALLISGDIYYQKKGEVRSFGMANRIVAIVIALLWLYSVVQALKGH